MSALDICLYFAREESGRDCSSGNGYFLHNFCTNCTGDVKVYISCRKYLDEVIYSSFVKFTRQYFLL